MLDRHLEEPCEDKFTHELRQAYEEWLDDHDCHNEEDDGCSCCDIDNIFDWYEQKIEEYLA